MSSERLKAPGARQGVMYVLFSLKYFKTEGNKVEIFSFTLKYQKMANKTNDWEFQPKLKKK